MDLDQSVTCLLNSIFQKFNCFSQNAAKTFSDLNFDSSFQNVYNSVVGAIPNNPQPFCCVVVGICNKRKCFELQSKSSAWIYYEVDLPISTMELPTVGFIFETEHRKENRCSPQALDGGGGGRQSERERERECKSVWWIFRSWFWSALWVLRARLKKCLTG